MLCERTKAATEGEAATPAEAPAAERGPTGATPAQADSGMQREASDGNGDEPRLNETAHEQSGWISPKVWQKCVNKLSARILSLLPDGMAPGDAGTGAPVTSRIAPVLRCSFVLKRWAARQIANLIIPMHRCTWIRSQLCMRPDLAAQ